MDDKYKSKYRIPSSRLENWDYGSQGLYFVTICTKDKLHYFGDIISAPATETQNIDYAETTQTQNTDAAWATETQNIASLRRTQIGEIALSNWIDIPSHFSFIELDEFVIMPNHIHGILFINQPDKESRQVNKFGVQSQNLASVIRGYKASVKTYATKNRIEFNWQPRYHDRVIRNQKELANIRQYIYNNPENWLLKGDDEM